MPSQTDFVGCACAVDRSTNTVASGTRTMAAICFMMLLEESRGQKSIPIISRGPARRAGPRRRSHCRAAHKLLRRHPLLLTCRARLRLRECERQVLARVVPAADRDDDVLA